MIVIVIVIIIVVILIINAPRQNCLGSLPKRPRLSRLHSTVHQPSGH